MLMMIRMFTIVTELHDTVTQYLVLH